MLRAGAWPRENAQFWQQIDQHIDNICYIEFTGGEPFMIQEHFDMLQGIVDRGIAHQVEIHYNTNGTHYPESAPDIWQHFKTVEIALSIDDVAERFEYQRTNAVWTDVLKNVARFRQLRTELPNIQLQCCTTVNVFNIRYLRQVADWIDCQGFDFVYWNMMHDAWYFSIATLPDIVKKSLTAYLNNCNPPQQFRDEFVRIRDFMNNGASTDGFMLRMKIADLDRKRNQDFAAVCPEMSKLIEYVKT
jgi:sulfatase maturation enzyme AslB (radical SAM superfamily)